MTLLTTFKGNPPADDSLIRRAEAESGVGLPEDYVQFLQGANGGEGFVGSAHVVLWRVEEIAEKNMAYEIARNAPGFASIRFGRRR